MLKQFKTKRASYAVLAALSLALFPASALFAQQPVELSEKIESIPTYPFGLADKNPIFYTGRVYQGAQGRVYPYAMRDILSDAKENAPYRLLYLENEYIKVGVAPDLGGRIFQATDKTDGYEFFYRQHVVKPALIGMIGAWISGGVEWNIPHHHRPSSLMSIDWATSEEADGSKVVRVGETEIRQRMKWDVALRVYPGRSYIEAEVTVENRSPFTQSMLSWANVSVHCNEDYQVVFPPNVQHGTGHSKIDFCTWPIENGVDISMWKNHDKYSRSVFAWDFDSDFLAGYDFGKDAGTTHVGNHHVVGGKKFFLWGNHPRARVWDEALTDEDGSYLELMVGGWSDNQPDYSWIGPYETRRYKHYWFPISKIKHVKNANLNGAVNVARTATDKLFVGYCPTQEYKNVKFIVEADGKELWTQTADAAPGSPFTASVELGGEAANYEDCAFKFQVVDADGNELIAYRPVKLEEEPTPEPVAPTGNPKDYKTVEELYLAGLRLEQFHNGQRDPMEFYNEALSRDPGDARVNTAVGVRLLRNAKYEEAANHLETALKRLEKGYTRVKDGEPHYYLGLAYRGLGRDKDAEDQYWKASWTTGYQAAAFYQLAELAAKRGAYAETLELLDRSLTVNADDPKAIAFKAWTIRKLVDAGATAGKLQIAGNRLYESTDISREAAKAILEKAIENNPLNYPAKLELGFLNGNIAQAFKALEDGRGTIDDRADDAVIRQQELLETAVDYMNRGAWSDAAELLDAAIDYGEVFSHISTVWYYRGYAALNLGDSGAAKAAFARASGLSNDYVFAFRAEELAMYRAIVELDPNDAQANYEYGCALYYLENFDEAEARWQACVQNRPDYARAWRNLGFAAGRRGKTDDALACYEKALNADPNDPRFIYEYDQLAAKAGQDPQQRLDALKRFLPAVFQYDDCVARLVELYIATGDYDQAIETLTNRHFHVWEGGRDVHSAFVDARLLRGIRRLGEEDFKGALTDFQAAADYPKNFEAAPPIGGGQNAKIYYLTALAYEKQGDAVGASRAYADAAAQENAPNSVNSEPTYYRVLALRKLGKLEEALKLEQEFSAAVAQEAKNSPTIDEFSKFGEEGTNAERAAKAFFKQALDAKLKGNTDDAKRLFEAAAKLAPNMIWAPVMLADPIE